MAKCSVILLGIFVMTCGTATSGQQVKMSIQGTDDILQKLQPEIGQISKLMATSTGQGTPETEGLISKHITQSLEVVLEKWETIINTTQGDSNAICCQCNKCKVYLTVCGRTCCIFGSGGCSCSSCSSDKLQNVLEVGSGTTASVKSWLESAKNQLQASLADLMENINAEKSKCCTCLICESDVYFVFLILRFVFALNCTYCFHLPTQFRKTTSCFIPFCCNQGGKLCKCITCSAGRGELVASMDSISDSTILTEGTQPALDRINALFDNLLVLLNIP